MDGIFLRVIISVFGILKLSNECMRKSVLVKVLSISTSAIWGGNTKNELYRSKRSTTFQECRLSYLEPLGWDIFATHCRFDVGFLVSRMNAGIFQSQHFQAGLFNKIDEFLSGLFLLGVEASLYYPYLINSLRSRIGFKLKTDNMRDSHRLGR